MTSTDYVLDGPSRQLCTEDDLPNSLARV